MTAYTASTHAEWRARRPAGNGAPRELCSDLRIVVEEVLPTPDEGLIFFHTPDTMPDAPNSGSNTRSKPPGLGNQVAMLPTPKAGDADLGVPRTSGGPAEKSTHLATRLHYTDFGQYAAAVARQEAAFGHPAPSPTEPGKNRPRLSARFCEWMMAVPPGWITDVPGITRNEALKLAGNGVVPPQAAAALRDMLPHALAALREGQAA